MSMTTDEPEFSWASVRESVLSRRATRWYVGATVALLWLVIFGFDLWPHLGSVGRQLGAIGALVLFGAAFVIAPPFGWALPARYRLLPAAALWLLSLGFAFFVGWGVYQVWTYVGVAAAMTVPPFTRLLGVLAPLALLSILFEVKHGASGDSLITAPLVTLSISLMIGAFARQVMLNNQLRATQDEMSRLAVEHERGRVARDLHDILGHSLTVITIKAELAGRLVASDPARARREIEEVEDLARGALGDVRSTVSGFRGVTLAGELANAGSVLMNSGIRADLPKTTDAVTSEYRELFGWVVREGVTNVLRHSGATVCRISLSPRSVTVEDDGTGPGPESGGGTGLAGLGERVATYDGRMRVDRSPLGGFRLGVTL